MIRVYSYTTHLPGGTQFKAEVWIDGRLYAYTGIEATAAELRAAAKRINGVFLCKQCGDVLIEGLCYTNHNEWARR